MAASCRYCGTDLHLEGKHWMGGNDSPHCGIDGEPHEAVGEGASVKPIDMLNHLAESNIRNRVDGLFNDRREN